MLYQIASLRKRETAASDTSHVFSGHFHFVAPQQHAHYATVHIHAATVLRQNTGQPPSL